MIDLVGSKTVMLDAGVRKGPKVDAKVASSEVDAPAAAATEHVPVVDLTSLKGNGLSEQPFDYAKVISLKQSIKNGEYKIDYNKLASSMIETDVLKQDPKR